MGEDTPIQTPPDGQHDGLHIPINQAEVPNEATQGLGGAAIEQVTDQPLQSANPAIDSTTGQTRPREEEPATRIEDADLAHDMAKAGNYERTGAADIRRGITAERSFKDTLYGIVNDPRYLDESFRNKIMVFMATHDIAAGLDITSPTQPAYRWGKQLPKHVSGWALESMDQLDESIGTVNPDIGWDNRYNPIVASREVLSGEYDPSEYDPSKATLNQGYNNLERARQLDESAERNEEWTKLLHNKPVSDDYKAEHPDFGFGTNEMILLENIVDKSDGKRFQEGYLNEEQFDDPKNISFVSVGKSLQGAVEVLVEKGTGEDVEGLLSEYSQLVTNESTTLGDLVGLDKRLRQRHNALLKAKVEERKQVLEDVRSGRASEPPEPTEEQQAA